MYWFAAVKQNATAILDVPFIKFLKKSVVNKA